jgi:hypothetical protein
MIIGLVHILSRPRGREVKAAGLDGRRLTAYGSRLALMAGEMRCASVRDITK